MFDIPTGKWNAAAQFILRPAHDSTTCPDVLKTVLAGAAWPGDPLPLRSSILTSKLYQESGLRRIAHTAIVHPEAVRTQGLENSRRALLTLADSPFGVPVIFDPAVRLGHRSGTVTIGLGPLGASLASNPEAIVWPDIAAACSEADWQDLCISSRSRPARQQVLSATLIL